MHHLRLAAALMLAAVLSVIPSVAGAWTGSRHVSPWRVIASPASVPHIVQPSSLAIDLHGKPSAAKWMYATDNATHSVIKLGTGGHYITQWHYSGRTRFQASAGIAVGGSEKLFVADSYNAMVRKFSPTGAPLEKWHYANAKSTGGGLSSAAVDAKGDVYVSSTVTLLLQKYSPAGKLLRTIRMPPRGGNGNSIPESISIAPGGDLYLIDACDESKCTNGRDLNYLVVKLTPSGKLVKDWYGGFPHGGTLKGAQPWVVLSGLTTDAAGDWYVTASNLINGIDRGQVLEYSPGGTLTHQWLTPSFADGIAVDGQGSIYITAGDRILKLTRHMTLK